MRIDQMGPESPSRSGAGPCWVRTASRTAGPGWTRAVTTGMNQPQVRPPWRPGPRLQLGGDLVSSPSPRATTALSPTTANRTTWPRCRIMMTAPTVAKPGTTSSNAGGSCGRTALFTSHSTKAPASSTSIRPHSSQTSHPVLRAVTSGSSRSFQLSGRFLHERLGIVTAAEGPALGLAALCAAVSSATLVINWGRLGAAKLRLLTVNHGAQRTIKPTACHAYRP
jgi:hypothetical protein